MQSEIDALTARIERLERANRRLKAIGGVVGLASIALLSVGFGGKARTIEAEKIVILDSRGRARLTIGTPKSAGVAVSMEGDAPAIWLSDESGSDRTILNSEGLYLANSRGKRLVDLSGDPARPELRLYGPDGTVSWSAP